MPKLKSKASAKKRFRFTGTGKVRAKQAYKSHGMIKRTPKQIRQLRGTTILHECDAQMVRKFLPYGN
ncbi:50S ribosomal protein L35 [Kaustia mangrovi]|uniref:Large ribosomal subunit protein bL35 n=1 Tax=Kaustia mangrovi TaxID=2593653 RepID=A0A7S8C3C1_9HYPH|nr:50S ribosomal protein L35 [Kaustia mangrovi]QPC42588.1 50S ribosomal protein L35 [Kaustia mangrovi]